MSTATYKKSLQAQLDIWSPRIDKGQPKVRLRSTAVRKIITGAQLLNQRYSSRNREIRIRKEIRWVAFFAVLIFLNLPAIAFSQTSCPGIHVKIQNIKNSTGNIACGIFESPEGFPKKFQVSAKTVIMKKIQKTQAQCDFADIPPGTYAITVIHCRESEYLS